MAGLIFPIFLTILGLVIALTAYSSIRRGGARVYTLEREAMLRRAGYTLLASVFFFLASMGLLIYQNQQLTIEEAIESGEVIEEIPTPTPTISIFPPTPTLPPTIDPNIPTITPTPVLVRAIVEGTGGSGVYLRDTPGGTEIEILPEGDILTIIDEPTQQLGGFVWVKVRLVTGTEGWVVQDFLKIRER